MIATCKDSRWIFLYGFAKNERGNVDKDEERALKTLAAHLLGLSSIELAVATRAGELLEVSVDAKK